MGPSAIRFARRDVTTRSPMLRHDPNHAGLTHEPTNSERPKKDGRHRIMVSAPYDALQEIQVGDHGVHARARAHYPRVGESGPIAAAEAGRHLAILGSLAAAHLQPDDEPRYYLADRAELRLVSCPQVGESERFRLAAQAHLTKRRAMAETSLSTSDGTTVFRVDVEYSILPSRVFDRLFGGRGEQTAPVSDRGTDRPLLLDPHRVTADGETWFDVPPSLCLGHFAGRAALPVAKLMHALSQLAGSVYLRRQAPAGGHYRVLRASVAADNLVFAGERVHGRATPLGPTENGHAYETQALRSDGDRIGGMRIELADG